MSGTEQLSTMTAVLQEEYAQVSVGNLGTAVEETLDYQRSQK